MPVRLKKNKNLQRKSTSTILHGDNHFNELEYLGFKECSHFFYSTHHL